MSAPALPMLDVMQLWLHVGWALVLAGGSALVLARLRGPGVVRRVVPIALAVWSLLPGDISAAYWLGLAFQAPSGALALACAGWGWNAARQATLGHTHHAEPHPWRGEVGLVVAGILLGWALLLDTFAQWPVALYPLGFEAPAFAAVLVLSLLPLLQAGAVRRAASWWAPGAVALFAVLRLPTGNVWDAVLDPWLWVGLHGVALRWVYLQWRVKG